MLGRIAERAAPEQGRSKQQRSGLRLQPVRAPESFDRGQQLGRRLRGTEIWGVEKRGKQQRRGTRVRRSHAHANSSAPEWELRARKVSGAGKELTSPPAGDRPPPEWRPPEPRGRRRRGPTHRFSSLFVRKKRFTPPSRFPGGLAGKGPSLQPLRLQAATARPCARPRGHHHARPAPEFPGRNPTPIPPRPARDPQPANSVRSCAREGAWRRLYSPGRTAAAHLHSGRRLDRTQARRLGASGETF